MFMLTLTQQEASRLKHEADDLELENGSFFDCILRYHLALGLLTIYSSPHLTIHDDAYPGNLIRVSTSNSSPALDPEDPSSRIIVGATPSRAIYELTHPANDPGTASAQSSCGSRLS